jgi:hypothetical protein
MKQEKLKINGLKSHCRWEDIPCCCGTEVMDKHPIKDCNHCKFDQAKQSMPTNCFTVKTNEGKTRVITEIHLKYGDKFEDLIGWSF